MAALLVACEETTVGAAFNTKTIESRGRQVAWINWSINYGVTRPGELTLKAMENHQFFWENPLFLWPFSIAMLVHQRVLIYTDSLYIYVLMSCHYLSISLQKKISSGIQEYSKWFIFHHMFVSWRLMIRIVTEVKFEIWDTAGQERFRSLAPMYYRRYISVLWYVVMLYGRHQDGMFIKVDCYGLLWLVNTCNIFYGFDRFSRHGIVI